MNNYHLTLQKYEDIFSVVPHLTASYLSLPHCTLYYRELPLRTFSTAFYLFTPSFPMYSGKEEGNIVAWWWTTGEGSFR